MKERIINNYGAEIKNICRGCAEGVKQKCKQTQKDHLQCALQYSELKDFKVERVPETFAELQELCKGLKGVKLFYDNIALVEYIEINKVIAFNENGLMLAMQNDFNVLAKNRTISQMWQIIKNLVGK